VYGQLIGILGKYSKFASAGEKAALRQGAASATDLDASEDTSDAGAAAVAPSAGDALL